MYVARESNDSVTFLSTTPDRFGRTVKLPSGSSVSVTDPAQKKQWIDQVGPIGHHRHAAGRLQCRGYGCVRADHDCPWCGARLVDRRVRRPGPLLDRQELVQHRGGDQGFGKISYDANLLEPAGFAGLRGTNPDPWCRRRMRTGALIQGGNGAAHNNFELFVRRGANIEHWYRENSTAGQPWTLVGNVRSADTYRDTFHDDAQDGAAAVQSSFNRNYEVISSRRTGSCGTCSSTRPRAGGGRYPLRTGESRWYRWVHPVQPWGAGRLRDGRASMRLGCAHHWTKHNSFPWDKAPGHLVRPRRRRELGRLRRAWPGAVQARANRRAGERNRLAALRLRADRRQAASLPSRRHRLEACQAFGAGAAARPA